MTYRSDVGFLLALCACTNCLFCDRHSVQATKDPLATDASLPESRSTLVRSYFWRVVSDPPMDTEEILALPASDSDLREVKIVDPAAQQHALEVFRRAELSDPINVAHVDVHIVWKPSGPGGTHRALGKAWFSGANTCVLITAGLKRRASCTTVNEFVRFLPNDHVVPVREACNCPAN
jgi:hypothetical protein